MASNKTERTVSTAFLKHLKNIFNVSEVATNSVRKGLIVNADGRIFARMLHGNIIQRLGYMCVPLN